MMTRNKLLFPFLFFILILAACQGGAQTSEVFRESESVASLPEPAAADSNAFAGEVQESVNSGFAFNAPAFTTSETASTIIDLSGAVAQSVASQTQERLIIRTADLDIVVVDTEEAMAMISHMATENGGWVVSSNLFQFNENAKTGNIQIRVPSAGFNSALEAIKGLSVEVRSESTSGQDVTEEFVDLSSRLENLEATADRVRTFLDEADDVEDALAVNQELSRLEGEIEVIKGRIQFLSQSAAFSTINVSLTPDVLSQPIEVRGWQPQGIAREAIEALIGTLQLLANVLIWLLLYILPIGLLILVPSGFAVRYWWRRRQRPPTTVTPTSAE